MPIKIMMPDATANISGTTNLKVIALWVIAENSRFDLPCAEDATFCWVEELESQVGAAPNSFSLNGRLPGCAGFQQNQLTSSPSLPTRTVQWKQAALARGEHRYTDVKPERIERAIADDLEFLAAHPVRQSNRKIASKQWSDGGDRLESVTGNGLAAHARRLRR
jgi:hypothetical protein